MEKEQEPMNLSNLSEKEITVAKGDKYEFTNKEYKYGHNIEKNNEDNDEEEKVFEEEIHENTEHNLINFDQQNHNQSSINLEQDQSYIKGIRLQRKQLEDKIFKTDNEILKLKQERANLCMPKGRFDRFTSEFNGVNKIENIGVFLNVSASNSKNKYKSKEKKINKSETVKLTHLKTDIKGLRISIDLVWF